MGQALLRRAKPSAENRDGLRLFARVAALTLTLISPTLVPTSADAETLAVLPAAHRPLARSGGAGPTLAWTRFCERRPDECTIDTSERTVIALTAEVWQTLLIVNREVNERIKPLTDREHWGIEDRWDFAEDGFGDCEDFQLVKRKELAQRGLPRRALRMTVVIDEEGAGHAVMMVRTDRGDFILDNRRDAVLPWAGTGYLFVKREGQDSPTWVSLEPVPSPVATANQ
jgi:predicted transglutaminase-like cysteine proteinase